MDAGAELEDGELLVSRHVTAAGRSRAYLGGAQVPAPVCASVTEPLITIHGQSEQTRLGTADRQRELLDRFAGETVEPVLARYRAGYAERRSAAAELDRLRSAAQARAREVDLLRFGLGEIEQSTRSRARTSRWPPRPGGCSPPTTCGRPRPTALARLAGGEDEAGGALSEVTAARKVLEAGTDDETLVAHRRRGWPSWATASPTSRRDLARYLGDLEAEPGRLEQIAERRAALAGLTRKYGATVDEVLAWGADAAVRLAELEAGDDRVEELAARVAELDGELAELAGALTEARRAAADGFAQAVVSELVPLAMPHARLVFQVTAGRARALRRRPGRPAVQRQPGQRAAQPGQGGLRR